jgi:hypothetical protein
MREVCFPVLKEENRMATHCRWALLGLLVAGSMTRAQAPNPKDAPAPIEAEVRYADGSVIRATILQASLEVQTRYGKLTVPAREIRRIELGLHLTEATRQRIETGIRQLGSEVYKEREQAVRTLTQLGASAFPALHQASKSADLEVSQRAETALKQIRDKEPAETLRTRTEDVIETGEFPIVGHILTPAIRAKTSYFGEIDLKLTEMRLVRFCGNGSEPEVVVDAAHHGSAAGQWMDSGFTLNAPGRVKIMAAGTVDLWPQTPGQYTTDPKGYAPAATGNRNTPLPGTLLGRIGENGTVFTIGSGYEGTPGEAGRLYLHIVPSPWNNASTGTYRVQIATPLLATASR